MHTDELRHEVAGLADEIAPFTGDVEALHRRLRRIRLATGAIAISLILVAAVVATTAVRGHDRTRVHISGGPDKEVPLAEMTHVDAIVVPATPEVKQLLNESPVTRFAFVPQGSLTTQPDSLMPAATPMCFLKSSAGYAVAVDDAMPAFTQPLSHLLAGRASVHDVSDTFGADVEVFLHVGASSKTVQSLRRDLQNDPDIESVGFLSPDDAFAAFRREFANQPDLAGTIHASELPASFRLIVRAGRPTTAVADRYSARPDVDTVVSPDFAHGVELSLAMQLPGPQGSDSVRGETEIFLTVGVSNDLIQGVRSTLLRDPDVESFQMLDQQQAYAIFAREFRDQPSLVRSTKPSDLPVSFRVTTRSGTSGSAFDSKYQRLAGVDTVIEPVPRRKQTSTCP
jgi:cell division protein FtsX